MKEADATRQRGRRNISASDVGTRAEVEPKDPATLAAEWQAFLVTAVEFRIEDVLDRFGRDFPSVNRNALRRAFGLARCEVRKLHGLEFIASGDGHYTRPNGHQRLNRATAFEHMATKKLRSSVRILSAIEPGDPSVDHGRVRAKVDRTMEKIVRVRGVSRMRSAPVDGPSEQPPLPAGPGPVPAGVVQAVLPPPPRKGKHRRQIVTA